MKYSIPDKRELTTIEAEFLLQLCQKEKPEWTSLIEDLKVIARCACGKCPTILLGENEKSVWLILSRHLK